MPWENLCLMQPWLPNAEQRSYCCFNGEQCWTSTGPGDCLKEKQMHVEGSAAEKSWSLQHECRRIEKGKGSGQRFRMSRTELNDSQVNLLRFTSGVYRARQNKTIGASCLPCRDEFSCTRLISEHTKHGNGREALKIYKEMREQGVIAKTYTFVAALKACSSIADLKAGKEIHADAIKSGDEFDIFVANTLLDMYVKCRSIADARHVFERMPFRTVVSWTAMIMGYIQCDEADFALQLFVQMQHEGIRPNAHTFVAALKACNSLAAAEERRHIYGGILKLRCLEKGRAIHFQLAKSGLESDTYVATALLGMYVKCGSMKDAHQVFVKMPYRNVVSWNTMILGYAQFDKGELGLQLYAHMQEEGFIPDDRTFVAILKACSSLAVQEEGKQVNGSLLKVRSLDTGRSIHSQVANSRFEKDMFVATSLLDMYVKCGSMRDAHLVFQNMEYHDLVSWTALIMGYAQRDDGKLALQLYSCMQEEGFTPDSCTCIAALMACSSLAAQEEGTYVNGEFVKLECVEKGRAVHCQVTKSGFEEEIHVANTLLDMYVKCGSMTEAHSVFGRMPHHDVVSWTALIMGYAKIDRGDQALQLYKHMQHAGYAPDAFTFVAVLKACGGLASLETGKKIHAEIQTAGLENEAIVASSLVDMYGKCGSMVDAQMVFDAMPVRDVVRWSALIAGYSGQGNSEHVFTLFEKMRQEGIEPDGIIFVSLLTACSHVGLVDKGRMYFESMHSDYGISPTNEHYNCMVDLFGKAGRLDDLMTMVKKMPFKPVIVTWITILAACQKWKNMDLGRHAFEGAVNLDQRKAAAYVLMTNISMSSSMWKESFAIQALRTGIPPTYNKLEKWWWAESAETVSLFLFGGSKLQVFSAKIKEQGHDFDLGSILQNLFDDEKQGDFCKQIEKLVIAFVLAHVLPSAAI